MNVQLDQPGPSTWQLRSSFPLPLDPSPQPQAVESSLPDHLLNGQRRRRRRHHRRYSGTAIYMDRSVIADDGGFNGSCAASQQDGTAIVTPSGSCTSYYPDITVYCCSGVEGEVSTLEHQLTTTSSSSSSSSSTSTVHEPICRTARYSDSLSCFKLTAEVHCRSGNNALYGVCNPNTSDASVVATSAATRRVGLLDHHGGGAGGGLGWKGRSAIVLITVAVWTALGAF